MSTGQQPSVQEQLDTLRQFRQAAYECLGPARDAQFELTDAVLLTPVVRSFVELSQTPVFRRRWSSTYAAIADGRPDRAALLRLYAQHLPATPRPVLAGDHTAWPRPHAPTLRDRTVEHQPTPVPGNKPITVGQGYSTVAWVPPGRTGSWALPLLHERISSAEAPITKAADQLRRVCAVLPSRPIALYDAEYGCAPFVQATADLPADKVFRLRPNRCLYGPPVYGGQGRRPKHGAKFKLSDASTWGPPAARCEIEDPQLGPVQVCLWRDQHFRAAAEHPVLVVRIERRAAPGTRRDPKDLWLGWLGQEPPPLAQWWWLYLRRFAVDHWYRFAKQRQHWTRPSFATPEQAERWSDLMPLLTWELWLARPLVADRPRPWQKRQRAGPAPRAEQTAAPTPGPEQRATPPAAPAGQPQPGPQSELTPGRVCQGMGAVLVAIGTPARVPKPRGKALGWRAGRQRQRRPRCPVVKKGRKRQKKAA